MKDLQNSIREYEQAALDYKNASTMFDPDVTNRAHDRLISVLLEIRSTNNDSVGVLEPCLSHPEEGVRACAAWHLLWEKEEQAVKVLRELANSGGEHRFGAKMVLQEWEKGNLLPPWKWT